MITGAIAKSRSLCSALFREPTRAIEVESGGSTSQRVAPSEVSRLRKPKALLLTCNLRLPQFIGLNMNNELLQNMKLRQAINFGIDKEAILKLAFQNIGVIASAPMSPGHWGYHDALPPFTHDVDKAKTLLAEAGYADGITLTITTDEDQVRRDIAEMVLSQLGEVGITVEIKTLERGAFIDAVIKGTLEMFVLGWSDFGTPDYGLAIINPALKGAGGNMAFYDNAEVEELLKKAQASTDDAERMKMYKKAQEIAGMNHLCLLA